MAEGKKSFVLYCDIRNTVVKLPPQKQAELFMLILDYVNDLDPETDDLLLQIAFEPIKLQLKRDLKKWNSLREKRSEAGKIGGLKSGETRSANSKQNEANEASASTPKQNEANEAVTVTATATATATENATVIETEILLKKEPKEGIDFLKLLNCINVTFSKKFKVINEAARKKFNARLKDGYSKDDILNAITNSAKDQFHQESNFKWCTPEYFSRSTTLDKYGFESQPVKAEKLIVPHWNESLPANLGDGTPA